MKQFASFLIFLCFIVTMLYMNVGCGLTSGRHADAEVVDTETAIIVSDTAHIKPDSLHKHEQARP